MDIDVTLLFFYISCYLNTTLFYNYNYSSPWISNFSMQVHYELSNY